MEKYSNKIGRIPNDWDFVNAKDCISLESGMRPKEYVTDIETDIPSLGGENIDEKGCLVFDNIRYISPSYYKKMKKGQIQDNDIFINKDGANTGKVAYSKIKPFPECAVNEHVFLIRNDGTFVQQYLFYCLLANFGKQQILKKVIGSAQEGINNSFTKGIILPKPSLPEQTAIAAMLSKVDEAIAAVKDSIAAAERLKKSLMQNLLTGRMKPDGTLRTEKEFYLDEKFGKVPVGWEVKAIGDKDVCKINPVYKYKKKEVYDFIPMEAIKENFEGVDYVEKQVIDNGSYTRFKAGDILFAKITPCSENGKVAYIEHIDSEVGFASTEFIVFHPTDNVNGQFIYLMLASENVHRLAISLMEGTTGRQRIPWKIFRNRIFVPMPDKVEQTIIVDKILAFDKQIKENNNKIAVLERLKKSLMQNLLTGRVRVK